MSKDKYPSLSPRQMELLCLLSLKYFSQHLRFENWGISLGYSQVLLGEYPFSGRIKTNRARAKIFDGL